MKIPRIVTAAPAYIINLFKKIKVDNFIAGLIFGAIFSLLVNVITVQLQERVARQRALEAIEREVVQHLLLTKEVYAQYTEFENAIKAGQHLYYPNVFSKRLPVRVWESAEVLKYVFELEPKTAAHLTAYYDSIVETLNSSLDSTQAQFDIIYNARCQPLNGVLDPSFKVDNEFCNSVIANTLLLYETTYQDMEKYSSELLTVFHPTQDRLDSLLLRTILGDKSVEILKSRAQDSNITR